MSCCFRSILPLVADLLGGPASGGPKTSPTSEGPESAGPESVGGVAVKDRLLQLIIKGILYESCVDYCQQVTRRRLKYLTFIFSICKFQIQIR